MNILTLSLGRRDLALCGRLPLCFAAFWRAHRTSAWLLAPHLGWVIFASVIIGTLWQLNA